MGIGIISGSEIETLLSSLVKCWMEKVSSNSNPNI